MVEKQNIDESLLDSDWLKQSWDLPTEKDQFLEAIGGKDFLKHFMTLPAAKAMPDELRESLKELSSGGVQ